MKRYDPEIPSLKVRTAEHGPVKTLTLASAIGVMTVGALFAGGAFENESPQMPDVSVNISQTNQ